MTMTAFAVTMHTLVRGPAAARARADLARELTDAAVITDPTEDDVFEILMPAADQPAALREISDAVAAAGADEQIAFVERVASEGRRRRR